MQRRTRCSDASSVAGQDWIHKVIIDITVKDLAPRTGEWETNSLVVPGIVGESSHDNHVLPSPLQPAMERDHAILVMDMKRIDVIASQRRAIPA